MQMMTYRTRVCVFVGACAVTGWMLGSAAVAEQDGGVSATPTEVVEEKTSEHAPGSVGAYREKKAVEDASVARRQAVAKAEQDADDLKESTPPSETPAPDTTPGGPSETPAPPVETKPVIPPQPSGVQCPMTNVKARVPAPDGTDSTDKDGLIDGFIVVQMHWAYDKKLGWRCVP